MRTGLLALILCATLAGCAPKQAQVIRHDYGAQLRTGADDAARKLVTHNGLLRDQLYGVQFEADKKWFNDLMANADTPQDGADAMYAYWLQYNAKSELNNQENAVAESWLRVLEKYHEGYAALNTMSDEEARVATETANAAFRAALGVGASYLAQPRDPNPSATSGTLRVTGPSIMQRIVLPR